ncbi:MAG TPA: hypothetical protein VGL69_03590 [Solirubrobacteraceae bacterium]|jgi:hypothetical protein
MADHEEERTVEVDLPTLSADANHRLTVALRNTIGADTVRVPADRPHPSHGERPRRNPLERMTTLKAISLGLVSVALCVGLVIATALSSEWVLTALAFVALLVTLCLVTASIIALSSVPEYPDSGLVALLAEEGISDPEVRFSEMVTEFTPEVGDHEERHTSPQDDPARAIAEQQGALTATSGPSASGADSEDA